jgi:hypothetical protein
MTFASMTRASAVALLSAFVGVACGDPLENGSVTPEPPTSGLEQPVTQTPASNDKKCNCDGREFVGFTPTHYTAGLWIPGTCELNATQACVTDIECQQQFGGTCVGAQSFGSGFNAADTQCNAAFSGSVVCNSDELVESIRTGALTEIPSQAWYNNASMIETLRWNNTFSSPVWSLACCK